MVVCVVTRVDDLSNDVFDVTVKVDGIGLGGVRAFQVMLGGDGLRIYSEGGLISFLHPDEVIAGEGVAESITGEFMKI